MGCGSYITANDRSGYIQCCIASYKTRGLWDVTINTPRRKNWALFKAEMRAFGGHGFTVAQWKQKLGFTTGDPSTNPWDVYRPLYKGKYVDESGGILGKIGSAIGGISGVVGGAIGTGIGGPVGGVIGGAIGGALGGNKGGVPSAGITPAPRIAGYQGPCFIATAVYPDGVPSKFYDLRNNLPSWMVRSYYELSPQTIPWIRVFNLHNPVRWILDKCIK